jgi:hypothetical protein
VLPQACLIEDYANSGRTLICIPIGGEMLEKIGAHMVVVYLGVMLVVAILLFVIARWACLDYKWNWRSKI